MLLYLSRFHLQPSSSALPGFRSILTSSTWARPRLSSQHAAHHSTSIFPAAGPCGQKKYVPGITRVIVKHQHGRRD
ncbi:hypothetical protein CW304_32190 [Bacillus sp. UFRGS-B20]|nr:hypothetical protein CW304_32190 [Bacillus sp. UFRGS-B20]